MPMEFEVMLPSEYEHQRMLNGTRYACAPPPEQCLQPENHDAKATMDGQEARPPTVYPMPPIGKRKPHVVLLHGTACNSDILEVQLRELTRGWDDVDITYIQGSLVMTNMLHPTVRLIKEAFGEQNKHWFRQYVETAPLDREAKLYGMFGFALARFDAELAKLDRPVDALIGFSQGGLFATLLAARNLKRPDAPPPYRCVVLLNPPNPTSLSQKAADFFDGPLATPALVSTGLADDVVPGGPEMYGPLYESVEWTDHPGAHQPMPPEKDDAKALVATIRTFVRKHTQ